jgi:alkylated DNA repair protein (DNA oxidative demethylase)
MPAKRPFIQPEGFKLLPGYFSPAAQRDLAGTVLRALEDAPLYRPSMPRSGKPLSLQMSNLGPLGWISDKAGYRYEPVHPVTNRPWPALPPVLLELWGAVSGWSDPPEACLVNWYDANARLGLHVDADEDAKFAPVVSVSLGDRARFRLGGPERRDPTTSMPVSSGDVVVLGGASRRCHHGVDRIYPASSTVLPEAWRPGRMNLTLRRVTSRADGEEP